MNGLVNPTYEYDTVGNLLREKTGTTIQREITWTGFNMPSRITKGSSTIDFLYDADHARIKETRSTGATVDSQTYFVNAGNALFFEIETKGSITEWKHYIHAPSGLLMMRSIKSNTTAKTDVYFHKDHLGSITTITNNIGGILEQNSYDAFGKRRNANGSDATTTINSLTRRGFTEHEMLPEVNMVHMNGRVYEPTLGRFMSADPQVQFANFSQSYNRYSYTLNNPLSFTDPSGYGIRDFFRSLDNAVRHPGDAQALYAVIRNRPDGGAHDRFMMTHSWARAIGYAVAAWYGGSYATAFISGYETYLAGGSNFDIARASYISYEVSNAFSAISYAGSSVGGGLGAVIKIAGSAAIGCASAEANGSNCRRGATYAGVSAAAPAYYEYAVGDRITWESGENPDPKWELNQNWGLPDDDNGAFISKTNTFDYDINGRQLPNSKNINAVGKNEALSAGDFWSNFPKQGGALSLTVNRIPVMNAFARLHDFWYNSGQICCFNVTNIPTMIPALGITFAGSLNGVASAELAIGDARRRRRY